MEYIATQLAEFQAKLKSKEQAARTKIERELNMVERFNLRRDFYKKLQMNMEVKQAEAISNLDAAEKAAARVQQKIDELEVVKVGLNTSLHEVLSKNKLDVLPELRRLNNLLIASKEETAISSRVCSDVERRILELTRLHQSVKSENESIQKVINEINIALSTLLTNPEFYAE